MKILKGLVGLLSSRKGCLFLIMVGLAGYACLDGPCLAGKFLEYLPMLILKQI